MTQIKTFQLDKLLGVFLISLLLALSGCASVGGSKVNPDNYLLYSGAQKGEGSDRDSLVFKNQKGRVLPPWQRETLIPKLPMTPGMNIKNVLSSSRNQPSDALQELTYFDTKAPLVSQGVWQVITDGLHMDANHPESISYRKALRLYENNQDYVDRISGHAGPFIHFIVETAKAWNMPMEVVLLGFIESDMDPFALSYAGALGMWQFMPTTADILGLEHSWFYSGRRDVVQSTLASFRYLKQLHNIFDDWELAMAAYNSGAGTVRKAIKRNQRMHRPTDFWSLRLPKQTRMYVPKILALSEVLRHPDEHGIVLPDMPYVPSFAIIHYTNQVVFKDLAEHLGVSLPKLMALNSGYNQNTSAPNSSILLIPYAQYEKAQTYFINHIENPTERIYRLYLATKNETALDVIQATNMSMEELSKLNQPEQIVAKNNRILLVHTPRIMQTSLEYEYDMRMEKYGKTLLAHRRLVHTVESGDTLWSIASKNNIRLATLKKWNRVNSPKALIHKGDKLYVSPPPKSGGLPKTNVANIDLQSFRGILYYIKKNDSWETIASRLRVDSSDLKEWNPELRLKKGQVRLKINTKRVYR